MVILITQEMLPKNDDAGKNRAKYKDRFLKTYFDHTNPLGQQAIPVKWINQFSV